MKRIKQVNIIFLIIVILPFVLSSVLPDAWLKNDLFVILFSQAMYAIPAFIYIIMNRDGIKDSLRVHKIKISSVLLLILFAYSMLPFMAFISAASQLFSKNEISASVSSIASSQPIWIGILCVAVIPAILEETVYRGLFFCEYSKWNKRAAILLSAFLFGVLHQNLNQFSYAFVMGIVFTLVIEATDSIISTMILHFVINCTSVVSVYVYPKMVKALEASDKTGTINADQLISEMTTGVTDKVVIAQTVVSYAFPALVACVIAFLLFRIIAKNEGRWDAVKSIFTTEQENKLPWIQLVSIPLLLGVAFCIVNIIALIVYKI